MRAITVLLLVALAACIVQTCLASPVIPNWFSKKDDAKDKDTDGEEKGDFAKQLLLGASDGAITYASHMAQERSGPVGDMVIKQAETMTKGLIHNAFSKKDEPKEEQPQQQPPPPPAHEGEPAAAAAPPAQEPVPIASPAKEEKGLMTKIFGG